MVPGLELFFPNKDELTCEQRQRADAPEEMYDEVDPHERVHVARGH